MTQQRISVLDMQPGEARDIAFEFVPTQAKTYNVSVDGLSGSFEVFPQNAIIAAQVIDSVTGQIIEGAIVTLVLEDGVLQTTTNSSGYFEFTVPSGQTATLLFRKEGYLEQSRDISLHGGINLLAVVKMISRTILPTSLTSTDNKMWAGIVGGAYFQLMQINAEFTIPIEFLGANLLANLRFDVLSAASGFVVRVKVNGIVVQSINTSYAPREYVINVSEIVNRESNISVVFDADRQWAINSGSNGYITVASNIRIEIT